ncbi:MAG TPA: cysteine desulfurase, partial [Flavobacteriaceae bacterium]|nr:cysteine desulfurase [Flavobacteriaceae bacterium]
MKTIYLDNAATTPMSEAVISTMSEVMKSTFGNPSSTHQFGRKAKVLVEQSRKNIAKHFNVTASEIVFTAGGSEADNLILNNAVLNLGVKRIVTSKIEHHAVLHTIKSLQKEQNTIVDYVDVNDKGEINYKHLNELLLNNTEKTLVSLMYINNEIGNILDIEKVCELCKNNNALFHSDTVQGIGHYSIDLQKTPIDFIVASAHKFHGSKGVGFAIIKKGFGIKPILLGGEQERGARAGTENVASIVGMENALTSMLNNLDKEQEYISNLKQYFIQQLKDNFPKIKCNGLSDNIDKSSYIILNVRFPKEIPMLLFSLDLKGIAVSGGSACQSGSNKGSHVLNTILDNEEALKTSVRFSFSKYNTKEELDYVIEVLKE